MTDYSLMTYDMVKDLPEEIFNEWLNYEPEQPLPSAYPLGSNEGRCGFIEAYFWRGEEVLFNAVNHAWNSLSEHRNMKCILIGIYAGTGGSGKWALAQMLRKSLDEALEFDGDPPWNHPMTEIHEYHAAAMQYFAELRDHEERVFQKYADILNGQPGMHSLMRAQVVAGPWPAIVDSLC